MSTQPVNMFTQGANMGSSATSTATDAASGLLNAALPGVGTALGLIPKVFSFFKARQQAQQAKAIKPWNPGYVANPAAAQNAELINGIYSNYTLPGMSEIQSNLDSSAATAYGAASNGATTGADLIGAVGQIQANQNAANINLGIQSAQGKQALVPQVMQANYAAGEEVTNENKFNYNNYLLDLQRQDAYQRASDQNTYGAIDEVGAAAGSIASSLMQYNAANRTSQNRQSVVQGGSIFK